MFGAGLSHVRHSGAAARLRAGEPGIPTCSPQNTSRFRAQSGPLRGPSCPGMTSVGRDSPASNNTYDANTAKGAKTAGFISIRLRDETNLRFHETIFYTDAIGWKPAGTTPPCNK
jgi:hypothetical protein